jgi:dihydrofolate reductase
MISLITAMDENRVIGINNDLPWHISEDLKLFKRTTSGKTVIMGRNTYTSLKMPRGLPNRQNIVLGNLFVQSPPELASGVIFDDDINTVMSVYKALADESFVIGGASIYEAALPYADYLYISFVKNPAPEGDTFFPEIDWSEWKQVEGAMYDEFNFKKYERIK